MLADLLQDVRFYAEQAIKARFRRRTLHVPNLIVMRHKNGSDSNGVPNTMLLTRSGRIRQRNLNKIQNK
jgi:hypothetical protein